MNSASIRQVNNPGRFLAPVDISHNIASSLTSCEFYFLIFSIYLIPSAFFFSLVEDCVQSGGKRNQ